MWEEERLSHRERIIPGQTHDDFQSSFFADETLLYFYRAVDQIEQKLLDNVTFLPEKFMRTVPRLPKLGT